MPRTLCRNWPRLSQLPHSPRAFGRADPAGTGWIFADPKVVVCYVDNARNVYDQTPEKKAFPPVLPPTEILKPLAKIADEMWNGVPVIPEMETGASDSVYTVAAGLPSYGIGGIAIDQDDIRAHGKDEACAREWRFTMA